MPGSTTLAKAVLEIATEGVGFGKGLDDVQGRVAAFGKDMKSFGQDTKKVGEALLPFSAAIAGLGIAAVSAGLDFEKSMNAIKGVMQPTAAEMDAVRQLAIKLGADTVFSAKDAADAMLELGKAGFTTKESMAAVGTCCSSRPRPDCPWRCGRIVREDDARVRAPDIGPRALNDVLAKAVNASTLEITDLQTAFGTSARSRRASACRSSRPRRRSPRCVTTASPRTRPVEPCERVSPVGEPGEICPPGHGGSRRSPRSRRTAS
jgi:hypothetical protein